jgi:CheY-like chemotaxis protein
VLIVDDDQFFANIVSRMFTQLGWQSVVCFSMENGLQMYNPKHIHMIITDIYMPGMGGIEGIKIFRQTFPDVPIIAMSGGWHGMTGTDTVKAARKIGADAGLPKPIAQGDLENVLSSLKKSEPK